MTEKQIASIIYNNLDDAYCYNCRNNDKDYDDNEENVCSYCCRKSQHWAICFDACKEIAKQILIEEKKDKK